MAAEGGGMGQGENEETDAVEAVMMEEFQDIEWADFAALLKATGSVKSAPPPAPAPSGGGGAPGGKEGALAALGGGGAAAPAPALPPRRRRRSPPTPQRQRLR
jgi:hypothetical protein